MRVVEKVLELRKAGRYGPRDSRGFLGYRLRAPRLILEKIEDSRLPSRVKEEARRQYLVCVCAGFESYWRDVVKKLVEDLRVTSRELHLRNNQAYNLTDLSDVIGKRLTLGELVACSYTFQHPSAVMRALSDLLGIDAYEVFKKSQFKLAAVRKNRSKSKPLEVVFDGTDVLALTPQIEKCFEIRHDTVHHFGVRFRLGMMEVSMLESACSTFCTFVGSFIERHVWKVCSERRAERRKPKQIPGTQKVGVGRGIPLMWETKRAALFAIRGARRDQ